MDAVITKIFELENKAQSIVKDAEKKRATINDEVRKSSLAIKKEIMDKMRLELEGEKKSQTNTARERAVVHRSKVEMELVAIDQYYSVHKEQWLETLSKRIVGR